MISKIENAELEIEFDKNKSEITLNLANLAISMTNTETDEELLKALSKIIQFIDHSHRDLGSADFSRVFTNFGIDDKLMELIKSNSNQIQYQSLSLLKLLLKDSEILKSHFYEKQLIPALIGVVLNTEKSNFKLAFKPLILMAPQLIEESPSFKALLSNLTPLAFKVIEETGSYAPLLSLIDGILSSEVPSLWRYAPLFLSSLGSEALDEDPVLFLQVLLRLESISPKLPEIMQERGFDTELILIQDKLDEEGLSLLLQLAIRIMDKPGGEAFKELNLDSFIGVEAFPIQALIYNYLAKASVSLNEEQLQKLLPTEGDFPRDLRVAQLTFLLKADSQNMIILTDKDKIDKLIQLACLLQDSDDDEERFLFLETFLKLVEIGEKMPEASEYIQDIIIENGMLDTVESFKESPNKKLQELASNLIGDD